MVGEGLKRERSKSQASSGCPDGEYFMVVTRAVFHLEISALNRDAPENMDLSGETSALGWALSRCSTAENGRECSSTSEVHQGCTISGEGWDEGNKGGSEKARNGGRDLCKGSQRNRSGILGTGEGTPCS